MTMAHVLFSTEALCHAHGSLHPLLDSNSKKIIMAQKVSLMRCRVECRAVREMESGAGCGLRWTGDPGLGPRDPPGLTSQTTPGPHITPTHRRDTRDICDACVM